MLQTSLLCANAKRFIPQRRNYYSGEASVHERTRGLVTRDKGGEVQTSKGRRSQAEPNNRFPQWIPCMEPQEGKFTITDVVGGKRWRPTERISEKRQCLRRRRKQSKGTRSNDFVSKVCLER